MSAAVERITIEPGKRGGKPCVPGLRITVWDVLGWLGAGMTEEQIIEEHPDLEKDDFPAVYQGDVVDAVLENYERLDEEIEAELPLKRIWVMVNDDAE
jgi:uncharacterized protein (DUF433 family)